MKVFSTVLLLCFIFSIVLAQRPRVPPGYKLVDRVPAEGSLANRPPETRQMASRFGADCFWIKFCSKGKCFWFKYCSS